MQWPGYTSFVVGAVLPIFVSIPCLFHYFCCWSESCLGCLIYISCLFLAFYNLFVFHVISTQLDRYINVYRNCEYVVHFSNQKYFKNKKTNKQTKKPNDTFNRFHSPVIVHRKHEGAVTRHEFLPSSAPLQENISSLHVLFFWLRHWSIKLIVLVPEGQYIFESNDNKNNYVFRLFTV